MAIMAIALVIASTQLPLLWQNNDPRRPLAEPRSWWPYGRCHWLRFLRCCPLALVGGWLMVLTTVVIVAMADVLSRPVTWVIVSAFGAFVVLGCTAYVFGQPALVIPPWLRNRSDSRQ